MYQWIHTTRQRSEGRFEICKNVTQNKRFENNKSIPRPVLAYATSRETLRDKEKAWTGLGYTGHLVHAKTYFSKIPFLLYIVNETFGTFKFYFLGIHGSIEWNFAYSRDSQSLSLTPKLSPRRRKLTVLAKLSFSPSTVTTAGENKQALACFNGFFYFAPLSVVSWPSF